VSKFLTPPEASRARPRQSIYEDRYAARRQVTTLITPAGKFVGLDVDGEFVPADELPACCESPIDCERPECWTPINGLRPA
jgi:hypothetical protein